LAGIGPDIAGGLACCLRKGGVGYTPAFARVETLSDAAISLPAVTWSWAGHAPQRLSHCANAGADVRGHRCGAESVFDQLAFADQISVIFWVTKASPRFAIRQTLVVVTDH